MNSVFYIKRYWNNFNDYKYLKTKYCFLYLFYAELIFFLIQVMELISN